MINNKVIMFFSLDSPSQYIDFSQQSQLNPMDASDGMSSIYTGFSMKTRLLK